MRVLPIWPWIAMAVPSVLGCSALYNPNNLPEPATAIDAAIAIDAPEGPPDAPDGPPDAPPDAPDAFLGVLALDSLEPRVLVEGTGAEGSSATILVLHGARIENNATTVTISLHGETTPFAGVTVDNTKLEVSADGLDLAVPVAFAVDVVNGIATGRVRLDVTVNQTSASGPVSASLTMTGTDPLVPALEAAYLNELTTTSPELVANKIAPGTYHYSRVQIASGGLLAANNSDAVIIRAEASVSIVGDILFNGGGPSGTSTAPGPGGGAGGAGGAGGLGGGFPGAPGIGDGGGQPSGGGGGFGTGGGGTGGGPVAGDILLSTLLRPNRASGGAGGNGTGGLGSAGSAGGGGGGTIELTAGGTLTVGVVQAKGGKGGTGGANPGGGGSGGTVLLRSQVPTAAITATGGTGGGAGGVGRVRIDAPTVAITTATSTPPARRGPMFLSGTNLISRTDRPTFTVIGEKNIPFNYYFTNVDGTANILGDQQLVGSGGSQVFTLPMDKRLFRGINHFCLLVDGATAASPPEAKNCYDIAYLFTP